MGREQFHHETATERARTANPVMRSYVSVAFGNFESKSQDCCLLQPAIVSLRVAIMRLQLKIAPRIPQLQTVSMSPLPLKQFANRPEKVSGKRKIFLKPPLMKIHKEGLLF
jgi:hypothetical protein